MPITQERMLTCISAGLSAFNALELARQILTEQIIHIKNGIPNRESDIISILETIQILLMPEALVNTAGPMSYFEAWHQLQMEARHFREFKSTNARAKRYQQHKRQNKPTEESLKKRGRDINEEQSQLAMPLYQQAQEQTKRQAKEKLDKMKAHQAPEDQTDFRNYQPEEFE